MTPIRRAFIDHGHVGVETAPGQRYYLPNPTPEGKKYDPQQLMRAVGRAGAVNLEHWRPLNVEV